MVEPRFRSRSISKKAKKTPGGRMKIQYKKKASSYFRCSSCKKPLLGMPRTRTSKLTKSQRKPNRPYGGRLCSACMRSLLKENARG